MGRERLTLSSRASCVSPDRDRKSTCKREGRGGIGVWGDERERGRGMGIIERGGWEERMCDRKRGG